MKQYCRYCVHLFTGNGIWCEEKKLEMRENTAKSVNHCDSFEFCVLDRLKSLKSYEPPDTAVQDVGEGLQSKTTSAPTAVLI